MRRLAMVSVAILISGPAMAEDLDIAAYCKQVAGSIGGSYMIKATCVSEEKAAKARVEALQGLDDRIAAYCQQVADSIGGSYQILETCIAQEMEAKASLGQ